MFEPGTNRRRVYIIFDLRVTMSVLFGHALRAVLIEELFVLIFLIFLSFFFARFFLPDFPGFFFQAEDGIRDPLWSRGLGDVYKRQVVCCVWQP